LSPFIPPYHNDKLLKYKGMSRYKPVYIGVLEEYHSSRFR